MTLSFLYQTNSMLLYVFFKDSDCNSVDCFESEELRAKGGTVGREGNNNMREAAEEKGRLFYSPDGGYIFCDNWTRVIKMC